MPTRFPRLTEMLTGLLAEPLSERDHLRAQLQAARAKHQPTNHILERLRIVTTDELRAGRA